jgi:hypothetical protein
LSNKVNILITIGHKNIMLKVTSFRDVETVYQLAEQYRELTASPTVEHFLGYVRNSGRVTIEEAEFRHIII